MALQLWSSLARQSGLKIPQQKAERENAAKHLLNLTSYSYQQHQGAWSGWQDTSVLVHAAQPDEEFCYD